MNKINQHVNATSVQEAVSALGTGSAIIAGGTDILCTLKGMIYSNPPTKLVNIKTIPGLEYIQEESGTLKIGALTRLTAIYESTIVSSKYPALAEAAHKVGTPQLRNMGTIAGNLCQAVRCWYYRAEHNEFYCLRKGGLLCYMVPGNNKKHSALWGAGGCFAVCPSDCAPVLVALGATIVTNQRSFPIADLYGGLANTLATNEVITEIQVPAPAAGTKQVYKKWAWRKAIDFPEVSVAVIATISGGNVSDAKIVLGGVSPIPWRATNAENFIKGKAINEANAIAAGDEAVKGATALPHNKYKIQITKGMVKKALLALV
ncbi:MAG: FAD binding domain-containing protein [Dehalococcoidales bacterium]|jgi:xanthine dehydrogenase YagS FAD-binding subunit|nr:FAD binding domain-containing protein [Dehalococcoidales bacterium]MDX9986636.1 FAD binding domain-containing protein [Dehalococcoidales bacterium]